MKEICEGRSTTDLTRTALVCPLCFRHIVDTEIGTKTFPLFRIRAIFFFSRYRDAVEDIPLFKAYYLCAQSGTVPTPRAPRLVNEASTRFNTHRRSQGCQSDIFGSKIHISFSYNLNNY